MSAALEEEVPKKKRKRREIARRRVVNLPDDYSWWLETNLESLGYDNVPQAIRELSLTGLEEHFSVSTKDISVAYKKHKADELLAEIQALESDDA